MCRLKCGNAMHVIPRKGFNMNHIGSYWTLLLQKSVTWKASDACF